MLAPIQNYENRVYRVLFPSRLQFSKWNMSWVCAIGRIYAVKQCSGLKGTGDFLSVDSASGLGLELCSKVETSSARFPCILFSLLESLVVWLAKRLHESFLHFYSTRAVFFNRQIVTPWGVKWPFHRRCLSDIYIMIHNSSKITVMR